MAKTIVKINQPADAYIVLKGYARKPQEYFLALTLNGAHEVIRKHVISIGTLNRTLVHPRDIYRNAIRDNSAAVIVGHNHPSGHSDPSREDIELTGRLVEAGKIMGIPVLDHVIICRNEYYSFLENGLV